MHGLAGFAYDLCDASRADAPDAATVPFNGRVHHGINVKNRSGVLPGLHKGCRGALASVRPNFVILCIGTLVSKAGLGFYFAAVAPLRPTALQRNARLRRPAPSRRTLARMKCSSRPMCSSGF